jgi:glucose uptake protein GlcU
VSATHDFAFRILGFAKIFVSGIALIYLIMIGVYMIAFSDSEERIKAQKNQITYALIGFLFLNVPGAVYSIFRPGEQTGSIGIISNPTNTSGDLVFWNTLGLEGFL